MKKITFYKMVGSGNDFVLVDNRKVHLSNQTKKIADLARSMCQRKTGIGADGLLFLEKAKKADLRMRIFNADGSEAEMCGNGARCTAVYLSCITKLKKKKLKFNTIAGQIQAQVNPVRKSHYKGRRFSNGVNKDLAKIKVTHPKDINLDIPVDIEPRPIKASYIDTGVPHAVVFVEGLDIIDVRNIGRVIRYHRKFSPRGANVNFVEVVKNDLIKLRTYERGVENETLACGTGSVAASIITFLKFSDKKRKKGTFKMRVLTLSTDILNVYFDYEDNKISDGSGNFSPTHHPEEQSDEGSRRSFDPIGPQDDPSGTTRKNIPTGQISNVWLEGKARPIYRGEY